MNSEKNFSYLNNNKRAVLLLHGLTGHPYEMKFFGKKLSKNGFDVICPLLPGHCCGVKEIKKYGWNDWLKFSLEQYDLLKKEYEEVYVSGLCLGAVLACAMGELREDIAGICSLSTTLYLDGWEMPWYKLFMPIGLITILRFFYAFPEAGSYGIKNERLSKKIASTAEDNSSLLNCFPMVSIHELIKLAKFTMKNASKIKSPIILLHSLEDNLTSAKSSEFIYKNASSSIKELINLEGCYHVITLDNEKEQVAQKAIEFFNKVSKYKNIQELETVGCGGANGSYQ